MALCWRHLPALVLVPALGGLSPLPRAVPLAGSERLEAACRASGACDVAAPACEAPACGPCTPGSGPCADGAGADEPPAGSSRTAGCIVCVCCQCGLGVPAAGPAFAPPVLASLLPETPPSALASVAREPASPPPKAPPSFS
jgi:hypothetical protein